MKQPAVYLTPRQEYVITQRHAGISQRKIAASMGLSRGSVQTAEKEAWAILKSCYATIERWNVLVESGESMAKIAAIPAAEKHSLADVMA